MRQTIFSAIRTAHAAQGYLSRRASLRGIDLALGMVLCGIPLLLMPGCDNVEAEYRLVDSGQEMGSPAASGPTTIWLDNKRVMFVGINKDKPEAIARERLAIWDTETNVVETYKVNGRGIHCYNPLTQEISYFTSSDQSTLIDARFWFGRLGEESEVGVDRVKAIVPTTCEKHNHTQHHPEKLAGKRLFKLLDGHGYLWPPNAMYDADENIPVQLLNAAGETVRVLPFGHKEVRGINFYLFKQAYFVTRGGLKVSTITTTETDVGWWLSPDGRVEVVRVPSRAQLYEGFEGPSADSFIPTQAGIFISHHELAIRKTRGYLVRGNVFVKIIDGWIGDIDVSPDGCRMAFSLDPDELGFGSGQPNTLKMIDFCNAAQ